MKKLITNPLGALIAIYFLSFFVFAPYFNWQYAKNNGFVKWLFLGEFVATAKSAVSHITYSSLRMPHLAPLSRPNILIENMAMRFSTPLIGKS